MSSGPFHILPWANPGDGLSTLVDRLRRDGAGDVSVHDADVSDIEQISGDLATGASPIDAAVIMVDARTGVVTETRRHSILVDMLGLRHVVLAVNKMDLVGYAEDAFVAIADAYRAFAEPLGFQTVEIVPVSALNGDNVSEEGDRMPWYAGPTLMACLQTQAAGTSDDSDVSRPAAAPASETDQLQAHVIWMSREPMIPGRQYVLELGAQTATAWISDLKYAINVDTLDRTATKTLGVNDIGVCNVSIDRQIACDAYADRRETGTFILIDRFSDETVCVGLIDFGLRRATNLSYQETVLDKSSRAAAMGQTPAVVWLTGMSGAGKSTVANRVEARLHAMGKKTYLLDGDNVRHGLNRDLGFTDADRVENVRRFAEVAKLFADAGLIVLVSVISPFRGERDMARALMGDGDFFEVFVDASLATCEQRDPKGLYAKARRGEIKNFTGIDSPYEPPATPDLHLDTDALSEDEAADRVVDLLLTRDG